MANIWTFKQPVQLAGNERLGRIVTFYLWNTPVPNASMKGKTFEELGWSKGSFNTLHKMMRSKSGFPDSEHWLQVAKKDIKGKLLELKRWKNFDCSFEFAVHTRKDGLNKTENLFRFIRNSFAHGGFRCCTYENEQFYALENHDERGVVTGRGVISETNLFYWAKLLSKRSNRL